MSRRRGMQQQDLFGAAALEEAVAGGSMPAQPKRKGKRKKKLRPPPAFFPHQAVVVGIDPGATSGAAIVFPRAGGRDIELDDVRTCRTHDERLAVARAAVALGEMLGLPVAVLIERWAVGGPFGGGRTMAALGESVGKWKLAFEEAGVPERRIKRAWVQCWYAATVGGKKRRGDKSAVIEFVKLHFGREVGEDAAEAVCIAAYGARCSEIGDVLPKRRATPP